MGDDAGETELAQGISRRDSNSKLLDNLVITVRINQIKLPFFRSFEVQDHFYTLQDDHSGCVDIKTKVAF